MTDQNGTKLREAFLRQAKACASLDSPFMDQLCRLLADRLTPGTPVTDRLFDWPGDISPAGQSLPLRLCGALHALRLQGHAGLGAVYPPEPARDDALWAAVSGAMYTDAAFINGWIDSAPQTNEVRRSAALIAAGHWLAARYGLPCVTSELGASAGLNLRWDLYGLQIGDTAFGAPDPALVLTPDWDGHLPPQSPIHVIERQGVDLNPLNPQDPADQLRLLAYLWPDQPHRQTLTRAAIASAAEPVAQGDAVDWLRSRAAPRPGHLHMIYSTVAWQYLPPDSQAQGQALIEAAGDRATQDAPLAWFRMETDGQSPGAALTLHLWPGKIVLDMGRADFHGRWLRWTAPAPTAHR